MNDTSYPARQEIRRRLQKEQRALMWRKFLTNKLAMGGALITLTVIVLALLAAGFRLLWQGGRAYLRFAS